MWVRFASLAGTQSLITLKDINNEKESGVKVVIHDGVIEKWAIFGPKLMVYSTAPITAGEWHHIAVTYDGTVHALYIDGEVTQSNTPQSGNHTPTACWLGAFSSDSDLLSPSGGSQLFRGDLTGVRVWNVARTSDEILSEWRGTALNPTRGLVASWDFETMDGALAVDGSGYGNDATLGDGIPDYMPKRVRSDAPMASP
jgi:hypothetical protein